METSDDSDSFFDDPKKMKAKRSAQQSERNKSVQNLFGISEDKPQTVANTTPPADKNKDWLGLGDDLLMPTENAAKKDETITPSISKSNITKNVPKVIKKISFDDDDDLMGGLGLENKPKKVVEDKDFGSKKSAIMEDLLGTSTKQDDKKITSFEDILQSSRFNKQENISKPTESSLQTQPTAPSEVKDSPAVSSLGGYAPSSSASREGRRSRFGVAAVMDPLGILSSATAPDKSEIATLSKDRSRPSSVERSAMKPPLKKDKIITKSTSLDDAEVGPRIKEQEASKEVKSASSPNVGLPGWLGGGGTPTKTVKTQRKSIVAYEDPTENEAEVASADIQSHFMNLNYNPSQDSLLTQQKLSTGNLEYQNAQITLQQQESQLLMALQLKKYEENLSEMQRSQHELITRQEQQFSSLLERQFAKQQIMENNMRLQQERINNHIQLLISQPPVTREKRSEKETRREELKREIADEDDEVFQNFVANLKQKHHEEMFLVEESYKKQITLLEHSMELTETRLKGEVSSLADHLNEKYRQLVEEHDLEISKYKTKLQEVARQHVEEIKSLRDNHSRICEEIRYEYSTMIDNIKESRKTEKAMLENAEVYSERLNEGLKMMNSNNRALKYITSELDGEEKLHLLAKKEALDAKEEEIKAMREHLTKTQENTQSERAQLLALIRSLETKVAEQSQASREEQWALQQATAVITARASALDREAEFARSAAELEREHIKTLKETLLAEKEKNILQLTEEKLNLATEKARLDTSAKLSNSYDVNKGRAEIDAAIQVAKEAAEMTDRERKNLQRQQCEMESLKRQFKDREFKLTVRERELENMERVGVARLQEGERLIDEGKNMETRYNEKMRLIQNQMMSLKMREKKFNEDKIALSKERLSLHRNILTANKKCGLCTVEETKSDDVLIVSDNIAELEIPRFTISNPELLRFRQSLGLGDDDNCDVYSENELK